MTAEELHDTVEDQGYGVQTVEEEIKENANKQTIKMNTTASEQVKVASEITQNEAKPIPRQATAQEAPVGQSSEIPEWMK